MKKFIKFGIAAAVIGGLGALVYKCIKDIKDSGLCCGCDEDDCYCGECNMCCCDETDVNLSENDAEKHDEPCDCEECTLNCDEIPVKDANTTDETEPVECTEPAEAEPVIEKEDIPDEENTAPKKERKPRTKKTDTNPETTNEESSKAEE